MSDSKITVIPSNIAPYETQNNTVYISNTNSPNNLNITTYQPNGGRLFSYNQPLTSGNQNLQFNLSCNQNSILSTTASYIKYDVKFCLKVPSSSAPMPMYGRYFMQNGFWYLLPATFDNKSIFNGFSKDRVALCLAPLNSACILSRSELQYGGETFQDEMIFRQRTINQTSLPDNYQATTSTTWFDQDLTPVVYHDVLPYVVNDTTKVFSYCTHGTFEAEVMKSQNAQYYKGWTYKSATDFTVEFVQTFTIPLNIVNQIFDTSNVFYISLLTNQTMVMNLQTNSYTYAKIFGTTGLFDENKTGLTNIQLVLVTKESEIIKNDIASKDNIVKFYKKYQFQTLAQQAADMSLSQPITTQHLSVSDVIVSLSLNDENLIDSTYIKQRHTLFSSDQLIKMQNNQLSNNIEFLFFSNFNIQRANSSQRVFSHDLNNYVQIKQELLRTFNILNQYTESPCSSYFDIMKIMQKYAFMQVSLESFTLETCQDIPFDGQMTRGSQLLLNFDIGIYQQAGDSLPVKYQDSIASQKTRLNNGNYRATCIQYYDTTLKYRPKYNGNQLTSQEDFV